MNTEILFQATHDMRNRLDVSINELQTLIDALSLYAGIEAIKDFETDRKEQCQRLLLLKSESELKKHCELYREKLSPIRPQLQALTYHIGERLHVEREQFEQYKHLYEKNHYSHVQGTCMERSERSLIPLQTALTNIFEAIRVRVDNKTAPIWAAIDDMAGEVGHSILGWQPTQGALNRMLPLIVPGSSALDSRMLGLLPVDLVRTQHVSGLEPWTALLHLKPLFAYYNAACGFGAELEYTLAEFARNANCHPALFQQLVVELVNESLCILCAGPAYIQASNSRYFAALTRDEHVHTRGLRRHVQCNILSYLGFQEEAHTFAQTFAHTQSEYNLCLQDMQLQSIVRMIPALVNAVCSHPLMRLNQRRLIDIQQPYSANTHMRAQQWADIVFADCKENSEKEKVPSTSGRESLCGLVFSYQKVQHDEMLHGRWHKIWQDALEGNAKQFYKAAQHKAEERPLTPNEVRSLMRERSAYFGCSM